MPEWVEPLGNLILGPIVIGLAIFVVRLQKKLDDVQSARVEDAKKVTATLLTLNDKWNATIGELAQAVRELRAAIRGEPS